MSSPDRTAVTVRRARPDELEQLYAIRREVFVVGQKVPEEREIDGLDGEAVQFVALDEGEYVGTARLRIVDGHAKIERVAVRSKWRSRGVGDALMDAVESHAAALGLTGFVLSAQVPVIPFYERRGYAAHGPVYEDAGIPHRDMSKRIGSR